MDDDDMDIRSKIRQQLTTDPQFRNASFDPAPYLIQILKDKSGNHQSMIQKQKQLIQKQNKIRQLIDQICAQYDNQFIKYLDVPVSYAKNLQKLKSNVSVVKKKVKQTKALLLNTQKDIQQIHYNCLFNKNVYKQLKKIEVRLQEYENAFVALKNNQYYLCALNLPFIQGRSILQSTLAARSQTLRLRMMSKAIDQIILFLFFSPKVVLPSSNVLLDRMVTEQKDKNDMLGMIANWDQQQAFFTRYKLFKKADCIEYLNKIWDFADLDRKQGKLGLMYDIIKGIIRIGRINQITSSIQMYGPKQISNIFLLLKCFRYKQQLQQLQISRKKQNIRWFVDRCSDDQYDKIYISSVLNIIGVILRKGIIIRKIYQQFQQKQLNLNSSIIYKNILIELKKLLDLLYFPNPKIVSIGLDENNEQQLINQIRNKISKIQNYVNYGRSYHIINQCLSIIQKYVVQIQDKSLGKGQISRDINKKGLEMLASYQQLFYNNFHRDVMVSLQQIFNKDGYSFIMQSFDMIISYKNFTNDEIKYMKNYRSDDKKSIREYIYILSFIKTIDEFVDKNKLNKNRVYKYQLMCILFFYLKLNHHIICNIIQDNQFNCLDQYQKNEKKLKKKFQQIKRIYVKIYTDKQIKYNKGEKYNSKNFNNIYNNNNNSNNGIIFHTTDKLKIIYKQNQMILNFCLKYFQCIQEYKNGQNVQEFIRMIDKLQPANYDQQIQPKLIRVWDTLPDSEKSLKQYLAATFYKIVQLQCIVITQIYRETGSI